MITGYRKSPVAQIGADLFCDTRTIATEIARLSGRSKLSPDDRDEPELLYLDHLEGPVFAACLGALPKGMMLWKLVTTLGWGLPAFLKDRAALGAAGGLDVPSGGQAGRVWRDHLAELNTKVKSGFLGGTSPSFVDFSAYHVVWFFDLMSGSKSAEGFPALAQWQREMAKLGNGSAKVIRGEDALAIARECEPRPVQTAREDSALGKTVRIAPTDYGRDQTEGVLVASGESHWTIRRSTAICGDVHIHFPTRGYLMTRA